MDSLNQSLPPLARPLGPSEAEAVAARRSLNRWRMGCMILFTLVAALALSSVLLSMASGVVYGVRELAAIVGLAVLGLPVIFGWLRWYRALGRTLIAVGITYLVFTVWRVGDQSATPVGKEPFIEMRAFWGLLFGLIFLLGGLRVRKNARTIREASPSLAPVRPRPIRDFLVVAICASAGAGLGYRSRDFMPIRNHVACAANLRAVAAAIRDYQAIYGVRPATLDLLIGTTTLQPNSIACSVRDSDGQVVPFAYYPDVGQLARDILACDAADSHGPRGINILTGNGTVVRGTRDNVEQYLAAGRASRVGERMAESIGRGEDPSLDDRLEFFSEMEGASRTFSPQEQADMKVMVGVLREVSRAQEAVSAPYYAAIGKFGEAGGIDAGSLTSREALRERLELLAEARRKHAAVLKLVTSTVDDLKTRLGPELIQRNPARAGIAGAEANVGLTIGINTDEAEMIDAFESILKLIDETWGKWKHDEEDSTLVFEDDEHLQRYETLLEKIDELSAHQDELRAKLTERIRDSSKRLRTGKSSGP